MNADASEGARMLLIRSVWRYSSGTAARAGYRVQSFIRIRRICLIARIAQRGVTDTLTGPGFLGTAARDATVADPNPTPRQTKTKGSRPAFGNSGLARSDPSNQENPIHPDETLNSVAGSSGCSKGSRPAKWICNVYWSGSEPSGSFRSIRVQAVRPGCPTEN